MIVTKIFKSVLHFQRTVLQLMKWEGGVSSAINLAHCVRITQNTAAFKLLQSTCA